MKTHLFLIFSLFCFVSNLHAVTNTVLKNEVNTEPSSPIVESSTSEAKKITFTKDEYDHDLEKKVQKFKEVYFNYSLPNALTFYYSLRLESAISDHVDKFAFYDLDTFLQHDSLKPPQSCQALFLIPKEVKNREAFITQVLKLKEENKNFYREYATTDSGVMVRVDKNLKIKSFTLLKTYEDESLNKLIEYYISEYGYPIETIDLLDKKTYLWGIKLADQKYFLRISMYARNGKDNSKNKTKLVISSAYRNDPQPCLND